MRVAYNRAMAEKNATPLLAAYLVSGTDELKRQTVVTRLQKRISQEGDLSFNHDTFNGETAEGSDVVAACNTLPFASNVRLVQVNAADRLKKADLETITEYLSQPCTTTVLCLVAQGFAKNTRLYKAVAALGKNAVIDCTPVKRSELPAQVRAMATSHGITLTPSAANTLVDSVGESTIALDSALRKLALAHAGTDPISDGEVAALVPQTAEAKPWEFVDAFSERNVLKCLKVRDRLESTSPHALISMCTTRIRELIAAQSFDARGQRGSLAGYLKVPDWRVRNHFRWASGFTSAELRDALFSVAQAEQSMKSGSDPEDVFQDWYLGVIRRNR